jgi:hypothetical protein
MGIAKEQEAPLQKIEETKWSTRRLFPFADVAKSFTKNFTSVFDVLLGVTVVMIGVAEILDRNVSFMFYLLAIVLIISAYSDKHAVAQDDKEKK